MVDLLHLFKIAAKEVEELERTGKMPGQTDDKQPVNNNQHDDKPKLPAQWNAPPDMNNYAGTGGYEH